MPVRLRQGLSYGIVDGKAIFLDIYKDRYFALTEPLDRLVQEIASLPPGQTLNQNMVAPLLAANLIQWAAADCLAIQPCQIEPVRRDTLPESCGSASAASILGFLTRQLAVMLSLRWRALHHVLDDLEASPAKPRSPGMDRAVRTPAILHSVRIASFFLSPHQRCLAHSIALTRTLRNEGIPARLVLGVSLGPFAAHSWVQLGDTVLNDRVEHAGVYVPVLVI